jgi:hypothetical protein
MSGSVSNMTDGLYRRIYAGFLTGHRMNAVSLIAEAWFWRLHAIADDFGNLPGDPMVMRSFAAPRRELSIAEVVKMTEEVENKKLLTRYEASGDTYLHIDGFEIRQPARLNGRRIQKYPMRNGGIRGNPGESGCNTMSQSPPIPIPIPIPIPSNTPPTPPGGIEFVETKMEGRIRVTWAISDPKRLARLAQRFEKLGDEAEIGRRRARLRDLWGDKADTPESLLKHWGKCGQATLTTTIPGQPSKAEQAAMEAEWAEQRKRKAE